MISESNARAILTFLQYRDVAELNIDPSNRRNGKQMLEDHPISEERIGEIMKIVEKHAEAIREEVGADMAIADIAVFLKNGAMVSARPAEAETESHLS